MDSDETAAALTALLPEVGAQMAGAARHILAHPQDVAVFSMRELARRAGVPPVTLVRLAQRLGLPGYAALRRRYVEGVRAGRVFGAAATRNTEAARGIAAAAARSGDAGGFAAEFFAAEHDILRAAESGLNAAALDEAVELLAGARRVFVAARRTPFPAAFALAYALRKARPDVLMLDDIAGAPEAPLEDLERGDVIVAITFAPYSRLVLGLVERAARAGARVIGLSDSGATPLARLAGRLLFVAPTASRAFPESALGALALANLLVAMTVARLGAPAQRRIRANEQRIVASGEYLEAGTAMRRR
ncbi:MurR/RpiR family transcriptional regulator [Roseomonas eburnea]|uniref:MurR/RpiR family transcriptional regulator n=1 Tax=Neoroseomonas eburnea TaxID=1346889 RepID=A0A9X9X7A0_9PROT|nr:MurR/RpiR family transcriptional regulator [Neoroseomonas eburnea]MBR0679586.1 MurR/RpiR family transcriptional regulator [Neoroseomonas eburnea]